MREMKDSGIEWVGETPKKWEIIKNKYLITMLYSGGTPSATNEKFYCQENGTPFVSISDMSNCSYVTTTKKHITELGIQDKKLQIMPKGTILYSIYATVGAISELRIEAAISQAILAIKVNSKILKSFYKYNLEAMRDYIFSNASGNTQFNLNAEKVRNFYFVHPPLSEQQKISTYLDTKCTKIDSIIEKQEKVIEKLKAYKLSVITEAVTKGLNSDVKMKDSGVEWIGEIPEECKVTRAGHIFSIILGKMLSPTPKQDDDTFENYLCAANVHFTGISYESLKQMWFSEIEKQIYAVKYGDLLVVEGGAGAGGAAIVEEKLNNCYIQNSIMIVRSKGNVSNKWLYYTLYAIVKRNYVDFVCNKATIPHFTKDKLGNVPVVVFTEENETEIVNYLDKKCFAIDSAIEKKQAIIEKLKEYKKSLIYEVVTGKREV